MYINITDSETADNKGSSSSLVHYLDKENRADKEKQPELWFNQERGDINSFDAIQALDKNVAKLMRTEAKFFLVNISPSQKEIAFLKEKYGEEGAKEHLKAYAVKIMDEYAQNFKRPGINSSKDLLWFGKLENHRYYGPKDPEVKQGLKKRGECKPGEQMHIQVIVSRKDITNKIKLSPMNNSKGRNAAHSQKMGQFDRSAFKQSGERVFDQHFGFERDFKDTFRYANEQKKGSLEQRIALHSEQRRQESAQQNKASGKSQKWQPVKSQLRAQETGSLLKIVSGKAGYDVAPSITRKQKKRSRTNRTRDYHFKKSTMNTGEDIHGLRKIIDFTRLISIAILILHFYCCCYQAFAGWHWTATITDRIVSNIARTGLFNNLWKPKLAALLFLIISLVGVKGRKDEKVNYRNITAYLLTGLLIYLSSILCFYLPVSLPLIAIAYMALTGTGYLLILTGGTYLSRYLKDKLNNDIFNTENETFPQQEELLENEYSVNLPAKYNLKGKVRDSWINFINPFRGVLVAGTPGAGKSYFVIRHIIDQHIKKGFSMFIYDFKFDDLSKIAYNKLKQYQNNYAIKPSFYVINFDDLNHTHRCNPLDPQSMHDITDATEASRTIMMGLNREWIREQGEFFVESPINFLTAIIWYLRKYEDGRYCTLPHVIELMQADYEQLFSVLQEEEQVRVLINPFILAYKNDAKAQLEGQIASAKIGLARLASPQLYYVLSGNDFTLDLNNPAEPKIICMGNNPQKQQIYGAVLSLYISRMIKLVNRRGQLKSSLIFDEFPTIFFNNMDSLIATARSNKVATTLAVQDFSQLKKDYGAEQADVITGIVGNIISGQVTGDTAKTLAENFGKIVQDKNSMTINSSDTSMTKATQLDYAIPASKIAALSSGEFVGMVADNPDQKIQLKVFHSEIQNDHEAIAKEEAAYKAIPLVGYVSPEDVEENYRKIKLDIAELLAAEMEKIGARSQKDEKEPGPGKQENPADTDDKEEQSVSI